MNIEVRAANRVEIRSESKPEFRLGSIWKSRNSREVFVLCKVCNAFPGGKVCYVALSLRDGCQWTTPASNAIDAVEDLQFVADEVNITISHKTNTEV